MDWGDHEHCKISQIWLPLDCIGLYSRDHIAFISCVSSKTADGGEAANDRTSEETNNDDRSTFLPLQLVKAGTEVAVGRESTIVTVVVRRHL
jgi:hypothetical protein